MIQLEYGDTPPSLNQIATRGSHWMTTNAKRRWQQIFELLLIERSLPRRQESLRATASLRFPVARTRDEGNYRWLLEKALGDALVNGRWLADDDPEHYTFGAVTFEPPGPNRTLVTLRLKGEYGSP